MHDVKKDLSSWLNYLNALYSTPMDRGLDRVRSVVERLSIKPPSCPVITVAGTNGKGSVVGFLETVFIYAGYSVGAFTSPYLISFNEQFRINQEWISDEKLCDYFEKIDKARGDLKLTLFEFKTLAVLLYFSESSLDVLLLEVGLGGRLDAVNVIDPDIAVITSIGLDHCEWLGNSRELIASEKAGIFRADKWAICGDLNPPNTLLEAAKKIGAPVFYRDVDFFIIEKGKKWSWRGKKMVLENLPQPYLLKDNIATALMVVECLSDKMIFSEASLRRAVAEARVMGRLQILSTAPFLMVDVSHNEDGVRRLAEFLQEHQKMDVTAVFSVLKTKDLTAILHEIKAFVKEWHIAELDTPHAMPLKQIHDILKDQEVKHIVCHPTIVEAFLEAQATKPKSLVIFGSFYVASPILNYLNSRLKNYS